MRMKMSKEKQSLRCPLVTKYINKTMFPWKIFFLFYLRDKVPKNWLQTFHLVTNNFLEYMSKVLSKITKGPILIKLSLPPRLFVCLFTISSKVLRHINMTTMTSWQFLLQSNFSKSQHVCKSKWKLIDKRYK